MTAPTWQELRHMTRTYTETEPKRSSGGEQEWRQHANCRDSDTRLFYSDEPDDQEQALRICQHCPVMLQCRKWAITTGEPYGIFGGLTASRRRPHITRPVNPCEMCGQPVTAPRRVTLCSDQCAAEKGRRRQRRLKRR